MNNTMKAYQFKVILQDVEPPVWRRLVVPKDCNFADFANSLCGSMQWSGICIDRFYINKSILIPDWGVVDERELFYHMVADYLDCEIEYEYRFDYEWVGDEYVWQGGWIHSVFFEGEVDAPDGFDGTKSMCIDGGGACPPDEVVFADGYREFVKVVTDKNNEDREDMIYKYIDDWEAFLDEDREWDPLAFDLRSVKIRKAKWPEGKEPLYDD